MRINNLDLIHALDKLRSYNIYVHNDTLEGLKFESSLLAGRKVYLVETLAVINALVEKGTMLLYGGHGGGKTTLSKYLGQIFYRLNSDQIEECILRGHPQLTEEKILGSLDIAQLVNPASLTNGRKVNVNWNTFVDSQWKIIDELNRLSPYAQNILLSLLAEGSVKYHNHSKRLPPFTVFATMNPKDEGNFSLSLPFLDRFALALPVTMPDYESLLTIGKKEGNGFSENLENYLTGFSLSEVQDEVKGITITEEPELFINLIVEEFRLCMRITKEASDTVTVENTLCTGCHYNAPEKACNKIINPLSVRVKEDLYRYSKALAWFLGSSEVTLDHVKTLAPYLIWHRSNLSEKFKSSLLKENFDNELYTVNAKMNAVRKILAIIESDFTHLKDTLRNYNKLKRGELDRIKFEELAKRVNAVNDDHLIIEKAIKPAINDVYKPVFDVIQKINGDIRSSNSVVALKKLKQDLSFRYDIPNRQFLINEIDKKIRKLTNEQYEDRTFRISKNDFAKYSKTDALELYQKIVQLFGEGMAIVPLRTERVFDPLQADYDLRLKARPNAADKLNPIFEFIYKGPEKTRVLEFLNQHHVN